VRRWVYCTSSFSVCSLRRAKFPVIYSDLWLDYKVATHPYLSTVICHPLRFLRQRRPPEKIRSFQNVS